MASDFQEYRVYRSREEFDGTDVFELYAGDFDGRVTWWNPGSIYLREEAFGLLAEIVVRIEPDFDWYGETRLRGKQLTLFAEALDETAARIRAAKSPAELHLVGETIEMDGSKLADRKAQTARMLEDVSQVVAQALSRKSSLWILGL